MPPAASTASRPESTVQQSVFEGMFVNVLEARAGTPLAESLRGAGFDVARQEARYPGRVWKASLEAACREVSPGLPEHTAMQGLGARFLEGFLQTLAGRAVALLLPVFGPEGIMKRLPRFFTMGSQGTEVVAHEEAPRTWRVELRDLHPLPDFDAGIILAALQRAGVQAEVTVAERGAERAVLHVRW